MALKSLYLKLKGQFTIITLIMTVLTLIVYAQLYPVMKSIIEDALPEMDEITALLISLSPFFLLVFILVAGLWYTIPRREE